MANRLKDYFPLIRERKEVLEEIDASVGLRTIFTAGNKNRGKNSLISVQRGKGLKFSMILLRNNEPGICAGKAESIPVTAYRGKGYTTGNPQ